MSDPQQSTALDALAPFLALTPSAASPRAAADLISRATSAPRTYVFAELLQARNIQALRNSEEEKYQVWLRVLEIFCWGTWAEYQATSNLPALNPAQSQKLRLLTLLTLSHTPSQLTYPALQTALSLPTAGELESLLTTAIYEGLIVAKINPLAQRVDLTSVAPLRDLSPCSVPNIISILSSWHSQATEGLLAIESKICEVKDTAAERQRGEKEWKDVFEKALDSAGKEGPGGQIMGAVLGDKKGRKGGSILDNLTGGLKGPFSGGGSSAASGAKRDGTEMEGVISDGGNKRSAGGVNPRRSGN